MVIFGQNCQLSKRRFAGKSLIRLRNCATNAPGSECRFKVAKRCNFEMEPGPLLRSSVQFHCRVSASYRSSHVCLFSRCQCHPVVFSLRSSADDPGITRISLADHVQGHRRIATRLRSLRTGICDSQPERPSDRKKSPSASFLLHFARYFHGNIHAAGSSLESNLAFP